MKQTVTIVTYLDGNFYQAKKEKRTVFASSKGTFQITWDGKRRDVKVTNDGQLMFEVNVTTLRDVMLTERKIA